MTVASGTSSEKKVLRVCIVQGGKVLEEQKFVKQQPVTLGSGAKNTFVVIDGQMPKTHQLFATKGDGYELVVTEGMRGRLATDAGQAVDFSELRAKGLFKKRGEHYFGLDLSEGHRGKVIIGETVIIFQFVTAPPAPPKLVLPPEARGSLKDRIDWPYARSLAATFACIIPLAIAIPRVAIDEEPMTLEKLDERWAKLIVPDRAPKPKQEEAPKAAEKAAAKADDKKDDSQKKAASDKADKSPEGQAKAAAARKEQIKASVAGKGVLAVLGSRGGASGAVADVFGEGGVGGDLDSAFEGIAGVGLATGTGDHSTRGGGTGEAASIGGLATAGGGNVGLGGKKEARVAAVKTEAPEVDGALDSGAIAEVVRRRIRSVQDCYERELKRDASLAGKIEIEFTIDEEGNVEEARVSNNKMGSDAVGECIVSRIRRWKFPKPQGGSVTVNYPFIFTPSS